MSLANKCFPEVHMCLSGFILSVSCSMGVSKPPVDEPTRPENTVVPETSPPRGPCHSGVFDESSEDVSIEALEQSPADFVGKKLRVVGHVVDMYEVPVLVEETRRHVVFISWGSLARMNCRNRTVVAEGDFRVAPNSRAKYRLVLTAMRDKVAADDERGSLERGLLDSRNVQDAEIP